MYGILYKIDSTLACKEVGPGSIPLFPHGYKIEGIEMESEVMDCFQLPSRESKS